MPNRCQVHISRPIAVSKAENDVIWTEDEIKFYFKRNIKQTLPAHQKLELRPLEQQHIHAPMPPSAATQHTKMKATPSQSIVDHPQSLTVLGDESSMGGWISLMIEGWW